MEKNNIEGEQKPIIKTEEETRKKEAEIKEYARIETEDFFNKFSLENEKNMSEENFGPVYLNLINGIKELVTSTEEKLDREHAEKIAARISIILEFWLSFAEEDKIKDAGVKKGALNWLSEYISNVKPGIGL